ncbi:DUF3239 domain-containing protein [Corynebacterium breve]|uniref:DUF3239 domain-containing protein n=1 Tax=Corynebacterium breve TaxID=3049799 RepID=A0ABY8VH62_9CORY|nr:DUF3239 domain-containing protein [Corynebacterium breve]WIM68994.1 DUF3239 domain-containing protein [Corynebacterium breve]
MKVFKFDVDEAFAKKNNEMLKDTNRLVISGISLFVLSEIAAVLIWLFVSPDSPWRLLGTLSLALFGLMMLIVAFAVPRSVGNAQSLYDRYPLAAGTIAEVADRDFVIMALVNTNVDPALPPRWGAALRTVTRINGVEPKLGAKIPVVAVQGQRTSRDTDHWHEISPMPIAWGTPDQEVVAEARKAIPQDHWQKLEKARKRLDEVKATPNNLLVL